MLCQLCGKNPAIKNSHAMPRFVRVGMNDDMPTMGFRGAKVPNLRIQDFEKYALLCQPCETRFSISEGHAARKIFNPFRHVGQNEFDYGPWLHLFMTSLSWRTLALKLPTVEPPFPRLLLMTLRHRCSQCSAICLATHWAPTS